MDKTKILILEDEGEIRRLITRCLARRNYDTFPTETAKEAVELARKEHPDIALLDIRLGEGSGLDALKQIKEFDKNIKVIMVTVVDDEQTIRQAKKLGADDYVTKPVTVDYLSGLVLEKISELRLHRKIAEIESMLNHRKNA